MLPDFPLQVLNPRLLPPRLRDADLEVGNGDGTLDLQEVTALNVGWGNVVGAARTRRALDALRA